MGPAAVRLWDPSQQDTRQCGIRNASGAVKKVSKAPGPIVHLTAGRRDSMPSTPGSGMQPDAIDDNVGSRRRAERVALAIVVVVAIIGGAPLARASAAA